MNKKVIIALVAVLVIAVGAIVYVIFASNDPVNPVLNDGQLGSQTDVEKKPNDLDENENGGTVPNIISKSGLIKSLGDDYITVNGGKNKEIKIYVTKDTKIYGPDGSERKFKDLAVGNDITADIDGNEYSETDTKFEAMTIYVSGK